MAEDFALVVAVLFKYGAILFVVVFGGYVIASAVSKLRNEPGTLGKLILVTITPFALAIAIPYFVMHEVLGAPVWLCLVAGLVIYALSQNFLEKHVDVRFKDETEK